MKSFFAVGYRIIIIVAVWLGIGWLMRFLRPLDALLKMELPIWVEAPGILMLLVGAVGVLVCGVMLSRCGIGSLRGEEWHLPKDFLVWGPFRFVRNPMSLSAIVLLLGIALWHRSTLALAVAAVVFGIFHAVVVCIEEPGLEGRFGESYREYKRNVPRWLPRRRAWESAQRIARRFPLYR